MAIANSIRKLGFRRWHERQLIEAHACLVTAFLSLIVVLICMDQVHWREPGIQLLSMLGLIAAGLALGFKTVLIYFRMLFRAERFAAQATCDECKTYGVIEVLTASGSGTQALAGAGNGDWLKVRCRKCGHDWTMAEAAPE